MENDEVNIPTSDDLLLPTVESLRELGGSGRIDEIDQLIIQKMNLSDEQQNVAHDSYQSEIEYRAKWARTHLKYGGYIQNSSRGVWRLTKKGFESNVTRDKLIRDYREYLKQRREEKLQKESLDDDTRESIPEEEIDETWQLQLKEILLNMNPYGFENLIKLILRESGFTQVSVTKKTGDGGFDGRGIIKLNNMVSMPVLFECKRYKDPVSSPKLRSFRGAMEGRTQRGLFITTSRFTTDAIQEATRPGARPLDLIDGEQLIEILKDLELGIEKKMVPQYQVIEEWFNQFE